MADADRLIRELHGRYTYNPETGRITHRAKRPGVIVGTFADTAFHSQGNSYRQVRSGGITYFAHRLAYVLHVGAWPTQDVDHVDGDRSNNVWSNLRDVPKTTNMQNRKIKSKNTAGLIGVHKHVDKFTSQIMTNGVRKYLGYFDSAEAAHQAYLTAKRQLHAGNTV
jgi:hypothetical protein